MRRASLFLSSMILLASACTVQEVGEEAGGAEQGFEADTASDENSSSGSSDSAGTGESTDSADGPGSSSGTGESSDSGGPSESFCVHQCSTDADCTVMGMDLDYSCVDSICTAQASGCTTDQECVEFLSGWTQGTACTAGGGECEAAMQVCLPIEGEGHCAVAPNEFIDCEGIGLDSIPMTDIEGNAVIVCGRENAACHPDDYCFLPCQGDTDCPSEAYPSCNVGTGLCECSTDAGCQTLGSPQFSACNAGICGCSSDGDCVAGGAGDLCQPSGSCGCTGDAACVDVQSSFDGGMVECVPF